MSEYKVQEWITPSEIKTIEYSGYWNDETQDKGTHWDVLDGNFGKMEAYLREKGLLRQLEESVRRLQSKFNRELHGTGADLAAGTLWAVPHLLRLGKVEKIYCVEYSRHRLFKIGPKVLEHYGVPKDKVILVLGSFYNLKLPDKSLDFVFMSAALHHADDPNALLSEVRRVLKPEGVAIVIREHISEATLKAYVKHILRFFVSRAPSGIQKRLFGRTFHETKLIPKSSSELFPPDPVLGDHFYTRLQYQEMFSRHGFIAEHVRDKSSSPQAFVLINGSA